MFQTWVQTEEGSLSLSPSVILQLSSESECWWSHTTLIKDCQIADIKCTFIYHTKRYML